MVVGFLVISTTTTERTTPARNETPSRNPQLPASSARLLGERLHPHPPIRLEKRQVGGRVEPRLENGETNVCLSERAGEDIKKQRILTRGVCLAGLGRRRHLPPPPHGRELGHHLVSPQPGSAALARPLSSKLLSAFACTYVHCLIFGLILPLTCFSHSPPII